jgi:hypothetical protein
MRPFLAVLAAFAVSAFAGCGTLVNLMSRPGHADGEPYVAGTPEASCTVFGGAELSAGYAMSGYLKGAMCLSNGDPAGLAMVAIGTAAMVDANISLVGDIVTLPVAYARQQNLPWASWWFPRVPAAPPIEAEVSLQGRPIPRMPDEFGPSMDGRRLDDSSLLPP